MVVTASLVTSGVGRHQFTPPWCTWCTLPPPWWTATTPAPPPGISILPPPDFFVAQIGFVGGRMWVWHRSPAWFTASSSSLLDQLLHHYHHHHRGSDGVGGVGGVGRGGGGGGGHHVTMPPRPAPTSSLCTPHHHHLLQATVSQSQLSRLSRSRRCHGVSCHDVTRSRLSLPGGGGSEPHPAAVAAAMAAALPLLSPIEAPSNGFVSRICFSRRQSHLYSDPPPAAGEIQTFLLCCSNIAAAEANRLQKQIEMGV